jgi:DNA polymerase-3 subunit epsilon
MRNPFRAAPPATPAARAYATSGAPRDRTPWRLADYAVVDLELSGLDAERDEIISFAAVPIDLGRVIAGGSLYGVCRPTQPLPERSVLVHGIRTVDLLDAPALDEAIQPLLAAMAGRILICHVAWVERSFLRKALAPQGVRLREPVLDTCQMGRLLAGLRGEASSPVALNELAGHLKLPVHRQHHALGDAMTTAQVFLSLATHLEEFGPESVGSLARAAQRASVPLA